MKGGDFPEEGPGQTAPPNHVSQPGFEEPWERVVYQGWMSLPLPGLLLLTGKTQRTHLQRLPARLTGLWLPSGNLRKGASRLIHLHSSMETVFYWSYHQINCKFIFPRAISYHLYLYNIAPQKITEFKSFVATSCLSESCFFLLLPLLPPQSISLAGDLWLTEVGETER